jgi:membrane glycosyltransferase
LGGILLESAMSVFLAPMRMFSHSVSVLGALLGWKVSWAGQRRDDGRTSWSEAWYQHGAGTVMAVIWIGVSIWIGGNFVLWTLPVSIPLLLGPAISVLLSDAKIGAWLRAHGLLLTPEEVVPPEVLRNVQQSDWLTGADQSPAGKAFEQAVVDPRRNRLHAALARQRRHPPITAAWLSDLRLRCLVQGPHDLSRQECAALASDQYSLTQLHSMVWQRGDEDHWDLGPYPTSAG